MARDKAYYSLNKVRRLISEGRCMINARARQTARNAFGWNQEDIKRAVAKLQIKDFYKSDVKYDSPGVYVDYYKSEGLLGENVYIHFRVEEDRLIICSFKEIEQ